MFYKWGRIKLVLSELFDADDLMTHAGANGWDKFLTREINSKTPNMGFLLHSFRHLTEVHGEAAFQHAAQNFIRDLEVFVQNNSGPGRAGMYCEQIQKVLEGRQNQFQ